MRGTFIERGIVPLFGCQSSFDETGETMNSPMLQHIPLKSAFLCQDCDCVGNSATRCPACASNALMNLAAVLNRNEVEADVAMNSFAFAVPRTTAALAA
jgi:hypothetical protein